jgi:peptidoglycan/xylan/chitin deacetylase (PgdA/CDA1 family)
VIWAGAIAGVAVTSAVWAVRGRSSQVFAPSVWHGDRSGRSVALTFDDGPSERTPELLELLDRFAVKATFFVCGQNAERLPEVVAAIAGAGHEIGNHTWSHPRLDFASKTTMRNEIGRTQEIVRTLTGQAPRLFRAPYGVRWMGLGEIQREFGLMGVMWTTIGRDWKLPARMIAHRLVRGARAGDILCLHDGRVLAANPDITPTIEATSQVLVNLRDRQFTFRTVSAMLER